MFFLILLPLAFSCESDSEASLISKIASKSIEPTSQCLQYAFSNHWFEASTQLIKLLVEHEVPIDPSVKTQALALKQKLEKLVSAIENSSNVQVVSPAYQWAQSPDKLFLDIKFSHRLDSPGCLEVQNPQVLITSKRLTFTAFCARSTQRIKLNLDLEFFEDIDPDESNYEFTSVGRLNVNLKKDEELAWPRPCKGKKPGNVHMWWEMKEKYQNAMDLFTGEDGEIEHKSKKSTGSVTDVDQKDL